MVYFVMATAFNLCGVFSILHMTCDMNHSLGTPLFAVWTGSSFVTNVMLQKIVLMRAALVDKSKWPSFLRVIFHAEVCAGVVMFGGCIWFGALLSREGSGTHASEKAREIYSIDYLMVCVCGLFVFLDFVFSCTASVVMYVGLRTFQQQASGHLSTRSSDEGASGLLKTAADRAARVIVFARLNLVLVCLSVTTSTLFYLTIAAVALFGDFERQSIEKTVCFIAWLADSLFNDVCITYVGFGPTEDVLTAIGCVMNSASQVAEVGAEVQPTRLGASDDS